LKDWVTIERLRTALLARQQLQRALLLLTCWMALRVSRQLYLLRR